MFSILSLLRERFFYVNVKRSFRTRQKRRRFYTGSVVPRGRLRSFRNPTRPQSETSPSNSFTASISTGGNIYSPAEKILGTVCGRASVVCYTTMKLVVTRGVSPFFSSLHASVGPPKGPEAPIEHPYTIDAESFLWQRFYGYRKSLILKPVAKCSEKNLGSSEFLQLPTDWSVKIVAEN